MSVARRSARTVAGVTALIMVLAGCSSSEEDRSEAVTAQLGRQIEIRSAGSPILASLWLDSVQRVECTEPSSLPPTKGHYLAATIVLKTTENYKPDWGWWMSASDFRTTGGDGSQTGGGIFTSCLPDHSYLPDDFYLPDAGYYGVVLLDSSSEHGTLTYQPHNMPNDVPGWSWQY